MADQLSLLLDLQKIDTERSQYLKNLQSLPQERSKVRAYLQQADQALNNCKHALVEVENQIGSCEHAVEVRRTSIMRLRTQQGNTRKQDEYEHYAAEVVRYQQEVDELETKALQLFEQRDDLQSKLEKYTSAHAAARQKAEKYTQELQGRQAHWQQQLDTLGERREVFAAQLTGELRARYTSLLKSKGTPCVVKLSSAGVCGGCNMKLTKKLLSDLQANHEISHCDNCGRLLYL